MPAIAAATWVSNRVSGTALQACRNAIRSSLALCITLVMSASSRMPRSASAMPGACMSSSRISSRTAICASARCGHQVRSRMNSVSRPMREGRVSKRANSAAGSLTQLKSCSIGASLPAAVHRRQSSGGRPPGCATRPACRNLAPVTTHQTLSMHAAWSRRAGIAAALAMLLAAGCARDEAEAPDAPQAAASRGDGSVIISGDDRLAGSLTWRAPRVDLGDDEAALPDALERADRALEAGNLAAGPDSAIPLYQAVLARDSDSTEAAAGLERALQGLLVQGAAALDDAGDDDDALRRAREVAAVARSLRPADAKVRAYLAGVDRAEQLAEINRAALEELRAGRLGESGGGALALVRRALALDDAQARALQIRAAVESALIRRAEGAASKGDFEGAATWLGHAGAVREDAATVADARARIGIERRAWILRLRDEGIAALPRADGIERARAMLARMLVLAEPGNAAVAELRERIDLAVHYGNYRPGQRFTDAAAGGRGPQMVVVPHGGFSMGAADDDGDADDSERPRRYLRFDRGFALSLNEVSVGEFRRFVDATGYRTRAER